MQIGHMSLGYRNGEEMTSVLWYENECHNSDWAV